MMFHAQGPLVNHCTLLAVVSSKNHSHAQPEYPFPLIVSSSRLEVHVITNPSTDEFNRALVTFDPSIVYLQGQRIEGTEELGSLLFDDVELSTSDSLCKAFGSSLPATVYLEVPSGEKLAQALHSKGVPFVIYWKGSFSCYAAAHFRNALFQVIQSSCCHSCDAFQLAHASFRLYCVRNNRISPSNAQRTTVKAEPRLLGDPPKIDISSPETEDQEDDDCGDLPAIKIYDEDVAIRFLVCGRSSSLDSCLLRALEDGLNALLNIEIRGSKLHNRSSAPPPPLQAGSFTRGVVTMRCDMSTCSGANVSLLVSGSADTCFKDHLLENHIRNEIIVKNQAVRAVSDVSDSGACEPRRSSAIGCGASAFEVCLKVPTWGYQIMRQLAPDVSYRSLVMLGIASVQGLPVASFEKGDSERFLFFCCKDEKNGHECGIVTKPPSWFAAPAPKATGNLRRKVNVAALRPIPHTQSHKIVPLSAVPASERLDGDHAKPSSAPPPAKHGSTPASQRKSLSSSYQSQQAISLNPLPLKKHGCGRSPIQACSEEEFLKDVMQFLVLRGHNRLVPHGGIAEFPDAILNAKRLDLFNLYREVVSRGGFHVGNGINWKGQVFSKMRNHTLTNRMTGVGNTLKRHYETYLLEYELAHDDVDGECCLMCHSSAAGDWVNCGICGEWAHFGCDRRQGLGAFKDYAKTDGLEYICPHCSNANMKKKLQKTANGF